MKRYQHTSRLQQLLESIWYQNHLPARLGKYLLSPLSAIFCLLARLVKIIDTTKSRRLPVHVPVIVIGNISVGGTGKTPLVIHLANVLQQAGYQPCIITRGYTGKASQWPILVDNHTDVTLSGDEAKLMALTTGIPVMAGPDRTADIHYALKNTSANIILADDGLQHYKMPRDIEIVVIDAQRGLGNGFCLPAGPLRETRNRLDSVDFIVCNGCNSERKQHGNIGIDVNKHQNVYSMHLAGETLHHLTTGETKPLSDFSEIQVITGIGNPERFIQTLENQGVNILAKHLFADHHHFTKKDFQSETTLPWVMTEKDAVKCFQMKLENAWYLPVTAQLDSHFNEAFINKLNKIKQ